ncbi:TraB/GumN family protein [Aurantiacibacter sp. MUD11]|uniref:TraB/GumN family protein n=1 Tax=Aurantiacibacter sp. MUD11 TaxID=3003265 RepID=UPI0022AA5FF4|nr:TraB/GumN family protein [Aurantiacibacter sp. MUD11]WAT18400.1 TraB/GumN family protein [Aurantiacibacter sp. MUD11]
MMKQLFAPLAALAALSLAACAGYPDAVTTQEHEAAAEEASGPSGPALWRVADEDTTVYLFGTVHFLPEGIDWFTPQIEQALVSAGQFVSEVDTSAIPEVVPGEAPPPEALAIAQMQMQLAQLTTGGTLRDLMSEEDRAEYEAVVEAIGLPLEPLDQFEPWFAYMNILQIGLVQQGLDPSLGVERTLDAYIEGKDRAAFETLEQQFLFLDSLPVESQLDLLDETVENLPELGNGLRTMVDRWMAGDAEGLAAIINEEMTDPAVVETLLTSRNANWAEWIDNRMDQPGTVFIAVGAGHLAGDGSVQAYLAERGFAAERVGH